MSAFLKKFLLNCRENIKNRALPLSVLSAKSTGTQNKGFFNNFSS